MAFEVQENRIVYRQNDEILAEITFLAWKENIVNIDHSSWTKRCADRGVAGATDAAHGGRTAADRPQSRCHLQLCQKMV